ncbi:type VII secretion protein EccB [Micromonospora sp. Llam7]|uniref:type VII secretion protein EccB n=1 Tax=Micromonospora tarapacensis TaxID=2835305 RepID=UPI001C83D3A6|nr:type VII secretion protein EccB [Micromonospora tarapacensis]MBX7267160.1 type VII secretion protein EccB [Micromonospora tarapacensis]
MPSRQDQLHSYQFTIQRTVAALVMRETDPVRSPFRRLAGAGMASVLVAVIALGGAALHGLFVGGGAKWRDTGAVIVEKESGARFVYREERLHPVLNYASALLIIGAERPKTVLVSRRSIDGVPRGRPLGIADAPDSLPAAGRLAAAPWTVCSVTATEGRPAPWSVLMVGAGSTDGDGGRPLGRDGLLLRDPDGRLHLVWQQRRHLIRDTERVLAALATTRSRAVPVAAALLNAVPAGTDLAPPDPPGLGRRSARVSAARIGDVLLVTNSGGGRQYAVVLRDGLAGITELQAGLLLARTGQREPEQISLGRFAALPQLPDRAPTGPDAPPSAPPRLVTVDSSAVCARVGGDTGPVELRLGVELPALAPAPQQPTDSTTADHVLVEPGRGAVVESVAAPGATGGAISVVTDLGRRYTLAGPDVTGMLGYGDVRPVRLPAGVVSLVPAGASLDPDTARQPATPA